MTKEPQPNFRPVAPPPLLYLGTAGAGLFANVVQPLPSMGSPMLLLLLTSLCLFSGAILARWAFLTLARHRPPHDGPPSLVTTGPFRRSRNPIYVAMTLLYLSLAFLTDMLWLLLFLPALLIVMQRGVIVREEHYLSQTFGQDYHSYRAKVRTWL